MSKRKTTLEIMRERMGKMHEAYAAAEQQVKVDHEAGTLQLRVSGGNSKMGEVASVSMLPGVTCDMMRCMHTCARRCYAFKLAMLRPNVREAWAYNTAFWSLYPDQYCEQLFAELKLHRYFRINVGGDIPDQVYFTMLAAFARLLPETHILVFTKRYEMVNRYISSGRSIPDNLHVLFSGWEGLQPVNPYGLPETNISKDYESMPKEWKRCGGNCAHCACAGLGCWQARPGDMVGFKIH